MPTTLERTIPILPCRDIDEIADFYRMLGFEVTYRQMRPNPYVALRRGGIDLHFAGMADFVPEQSYGSCIVTVPDTGELFEAFAAGMRATRGKLLLSGIPRITRPRRRKNSGNVTGFTVVDPGGNWIRIFRNDNTHRANDDDNTEDTTSGPLAQTLQNAIVLGDSKGDHSQAAKILDGKLDKHTDSHSVAELVDALVYRAELAIRLADHDRAQALLARVRNTTLDDTQRERLAASLADAAELERSLTDA